MRKVSKNFLEDVRDFLKSQCSVIAFALSFACLVLAYFLGSTSAELNNKEMLNRGLYEACKDYHSEFEYDDGMNATYFTQETPLGWSLLAFGNRTWGDFVEVGIMSNSTRTLHDVMIRTIDGKMFIMYLVNKNDNVTRYTGELKEVQ